jgi:hypothetical protein
MAATAIDRRPTVADTDSEKASGRASVQAKAAGANGRTLQHDPTENRRSSRKAAKLTIAVRTAGSSADAPRPIPECLTL